MSFELTKMDDMNAIHVIWHEDFSYQDEATDYEARLNALLAEVDTPQDILLDMTQSRMTFNDILFGIQRVSKGETSLFNHPKARQFIVISTNRAIQLSAAGLEKIGLGSLDVKVVSSLDEARNYLLERAV